MSRFASILGLVTMGGLASAVSGASPGVDTWKYDTIHRQKGPPLIGLVVEQGANHILLKCISRKPGRPTIVFREYIPRKEIARIVLAEPADRDLLAKRLDLLVREREILETRLKAVGPGTNGDPASADTLSLRSIPWVGDPKQNALVYESTHFRLISNARPAVVELAAIQLEQVYAAYARTLPARATGQPTAIVLTRSLPDYQALARGLGLNLRNPAFYDVAQNRVVCASDLERLGDELQRCRLHHDRLRSDLKKTEIDLSEAYGGLAKIPMEILGPIVQARKEMQAYDDRNEAEFLKARRRLFQRLFHEAFHAYLSNFVYPPSEGEFPRWLNEGLAQIFETAVVEVGELRLGHADSDRLTAVRLALAKDSFPPVSDLLKAGPREFLVAHASERPESDRAYLASWALAFHLTFDRRLLGTPALDEYARALHRGTDPLVAFAGLVGQPLPRFEKDFQDYLKKLKPDGTSK